MAEGKNYISLTPEYIAQHFNEVIITGKTEDTNDPCYYICTMKGWASGCFGKEKKKDTIVVHGIMSQSKGGMKEIMDILVKHFKCNHFIFTNVIGIDLVKKLKGFKLKKFYWKIARETILNLEGIWNVQT